MRLNSKFLILLFSGFFMLMFIFKPEISQNGIKTGLIISANVIIPSLFPFMVCVFMLIKSGFEVKNRLVNRILYKIFGHNFDMSFAFFLSLIGGYPVGASLLNELKKQNIIDDKTQNIMLMYCVNAGPAFIISAIGVGIFGSRTIGVILLTSHICASVLMAIICSILLKKHGITNNKVFTPAKNFSDIIVESINVASGNVLKICSFITAFFAINTYLDLFLGNFPIIKYISYFTEVTSAISRTKNIIFISFLLGFAGLSIWFQIFSICEGKKINIFSFSIARITHGVISAVITKLLLSIFNVKITTFSNNISFVKNNNYSSASLSVSMAVMLIVLITFFYSKNNSGKILNDVI